MAAAARVLSVAIVAVMAASAHAKASRFNCTVGQAPPEPATIASLHPAHVSMVVAMGDSITAAFAARSTLMEARDISWSIGAGSAEQLTLPWLLGQYTGPSTPKLEGMSTEAVLPKDIAHLPHDDYHPKTDHLNVAESEGAVHRGSMDEQWAFLLEQFKNYPDMDKRWKVVTVWMTANDVCGVCDGPMKSDYLYMWGNKTDQLVHNISTTLNKVYVNLVSTLDLSNVARIQRSVEYCKLEHKILNECGCIDKGNATQLKYLDENTHTMNRQLHQIAAEWYDRLQKQQRTDMAVVTQSYQEGIGASLDFSFLNDLDCFHPSTVGHEDLAIGLWNSMLCTEGRHNRCGMHFSANLPVTCPTEQSVFYTGPDVIPGPPPEL